MIGEVDIAGVFLPALLLTAIAAFVVTLLAKRLLRSLNAYRFVWHAGLFDTALFVVVWWLVTAVTIELGPFGSNPL
jgi:protein AaeX